MKNRRAFVFSIDAFVSFSLALLALYSLVFFSLIPFTYYPTLMQVHLLAKDTLYSLSTTASPESGYQSALDYIRANSDYYAPEEGSSVGHNYLGVLIPKEFDYELQTGSGDDWTTIISSRGIGEGDHNSYKKVKAVSYSVLLNFDEPKYSENPYGYITCTGLKRPCPTPSSYTAGKFGITVIRLIIYV